MSLTWTRPIEQALLEVPGVRRVRSTTFRGATEISAQFDAATDMVVALQQAQGKVAELRSSLPADLDLVIERDIAGLEANLRKYIPGSDIKVEMVNDNPTGVRAADVERHLGIPAKTATDYLTRLERAGRVVKLARGLYAPPQTPVASVAIVASGDVDATDATPLWGAS